ncbi:MAG: hypothetical protein V4648_02365 [Bacteroidota bacterium]
MKKILLIAFILVLTISCNKDGANNDNPYLPNYAFNVEINRNLPLYSDLNFAGMPVMVNITGAGIRGLIVMYTGSGVVAFDAACPNQDLSACSTLTLDGIEAECPCDGNHRYNLFTGQSTTGLPYPLKQYRTELNGNIIRVYN